MIIKNKKLYLLVVLLVIFSSLTITGYANEDAPPVSDPIVTRPLENPLPLQFPLSALEIYNNNYLLEPNGGLITPKVIGGNEVSPENAYPWLVSLQYFGNHYCGGTLIDPEWILTAAHCWVDPDGIVYPITPNDKAVLGEHRLSANSGKEQVIGFSEVHVHPAYNNDTFENDYALLKLSSPATTNTYVQTLELVGGSPGDLTGKSSDVIGWGTTAYNGSISDVARYATINILADSACVNYGSNYKSGSMLCAGTADGSRDACQGDSGGPLAFQDGGTWKLAGIVSWGFECGVAGYPGVYSRVSSVYEWVHNKIGLLSDTSVEIFIPNYWVGDGLDKDDGPECKTGISQSGVCSYRFVSDGSKKTISLRQKYKGNAGNAITFSIYRKATSISADGRVIIKIVIINTDGTRDREVVTISKPTLSTWDKFTAQTTATKNFKAVSISVIDDLSSGTFWVDTPSLKIVTTQELLDDPSLETFVPLDWKSGTNFDAAEGANCGKGNTASGSCSLALVADGSKKELSLRYKFRGNAGDVVEVSTFRKATSISAAGRVILKVVIIHLDGSTEREVVVLSNGTLGTWQKFGTKMTAASDFKAVSISVVDDLSSGTMWFDDFFLDIDP